LIILGRKQFLIKRYLDMYKHEQCSIDKAAQACRITVNEMMKEAMKEGIKSSETMEEYKKGLELLK